MSFVKLLLQLLEHIHRLRFVMYKLDHDLAVFGFTASAAGQEHGCGQCTRQQKAYHFFPLSHPILLLSLLDVTLIFCNYIITSQNASINIMFFPLLCHYAVFLLISEKSYGILVYFQLY